ncbi:ATP-grasp ribosomal peptide maturase [Actinomadura rubrisoli]|uniref:ATP-grasp ribosomal peptide maturase n=1 Tax=Actinomadura rubrisoli TaxID=2530368 RepID=A0A4R5C5S2_9ACTN|nr:ATP-grasp ribosomal peptide maturase [Actinomadura rubrisoli]TDD94355.1 ATP-grasp ribosomal peptide maturase [Actinomadura rubrisoli]
MRDERPVLVLSELDDYTADAVIMELRKRDVPVVRLDPGKDFPSTVTFAVRLDDAGRWTGDLMTGTRRLDLASVRAVYRRRPSPHTPSPELDEQDACFAAKEARHGFSGILANLPNCLYVNHPDANRAADVKVRQLKVASNLGLRVSTTLVTNDLGQARAFAAEQGQVVYKPLTFVRYLTPDGPQTIWTRPVHADEIDETVAGTAHLFQSLVDKVADLRITVVGEEVFCVRIDSTPPQLDWRYDYDRLTYTWCDPPAELIGPMISYLRNFGLAFGCFDFGLTERGEPVFFECNPNGQWGWLEEQTGAPITAAFADLLKGGA